MGHDKTDKHIKQKLESRTIQPSTGSWDKLSGMLDEENEHPNKKVYYKYAIAASVLVFFGLLFTSQFEGNNSTTIKDVIVEAENNDANIIVDSFEKEEVAVVYKKNKVEGVVKNETTYTNAKSFDKNQTVNQQKEINTIKEKVNQYLVQLEKSKKEKLDHEKTGYNIDAEINALLAEASSNFPDKPLKNHIPDFQLDKETDLLLADAFRELNFNPEEDTVNETLKNKLFKQLEKGYFKSKKMLAERNQLTRPKEYTSIY